MLRFRTENLRRRLRDLPMLRALPPFVAGILLADAYSLPLWFAAAGLLLCGTAALLAQGRAADCATAAMLFLFGTIVADSRSEPLPSTAEDTACELLLEERLRSTPRYTDIRSRLRTRHEPTSGEWIPATGNLVLRCDSSVHGLAPGDRAVVRGRIRPFTPESGYGRLMLRRGYAGMLYLNASQILRHDTSGNGLTPRRLAVRLHEGAVARLDRLHLPAEEQALCNAMTAGDRRGFPPTLRAAYARSGASHLLAVSGLHTGIVFLLANLLLRRLSLLRRGHLLRNGAVIALIWLYAAVAGFPPSVVRAALMFSLLQTAAAASFEYSGMNALAAAAFLMLLFRPESLFDLSFQLSFIAVAGVIAWGVPLARICRTGRQTLDPVVTTLAIGLAATLATAPLIAHTFGEVSLIGLLINPLLLLTACLIVGSCTLWLLLPLQPLAPPVAAVAGSAARIQNLLVATAAELPAVTVEAHPSAGQCLAIYALFAAATLLLWSTERKKSVSSLPE